MGYIDKVPEILKTFHQHEEEVETLHVYPMNGGVFISKEDLDKTVEASHSPKKAPVFEKKSFLVMLFVFFLFLLLDSTDTYFATPTAFVYITPKSLTVSLTKTIKPENIFAHHFPLLTLSETKTVTASGRGHQDASYSYGLITFYNGLLTPLSVPQGTVLTGSDGVEVETTSASLIPAATPPIEGTVSVQARAVKIGSSGNIHARDIDFQYSTGVLALNLSSFSGGVDARDYSFVTRTDIDNTSSSLASDLSKKANSTFSSGLGKDDVLVLPPCTTTTSSDHQAGDEAFWVSVTVAEKCSALSYNLKDLQRVYSIPGAYRGRVNVHVTSASLTKLNVSIEGVLVAKVDQMQIERLIRGRSKKDALKVLSSLPSVAKASISGVDVLPYDEDYIKIVVLVSNL
jgi:hypothetical protein